MKKVSRIITGAAFLGMAVVAAACGKSDGKGKSGVSYNFTMWTGFGSDYTGQIDKVVNKFNEKHDGQIHISHDKKGDYDSLETQILNSVSTSTFPNIACGYPDHFAEYWKKGILNPLDDYIKRYDEEHGGSIISDYYDQYMKENKEIGYDDDGTAFTLGLPFNKSTEVMLCNGYYFDFFHEQNPAIIVPETWDQFATIVPLIKEVVVRKGLESASAKFIIGKINSDNHAYDTRVSATNDASGGEVVLQEIEKVSNEKQFYALGYDSPDNAFITILHQWNVPYTSYSYEDYKNHEQYGKALFWSNSDESVKSPTRDALNFFKELNGKIIEIDVNNDSVIDNTEKFAQNGFGVPATFGEKLFCTTPLETGRCLFTIGSSGGLNKPDFEGKRLDINPIPYKDAAHKAVISQGTSLGLFNQYTSRETYDEEMYQAFSTMVELTTGELQAEWVTSTGYFPASKSAYNHPTYQNLLNNDSPTRLESLYRDAGKINGTTYASGWERFVDPGFCGSNSIRVAVKKVLQQITSGTSIDSALDEVWSTIDAKVK